MNTKGVKDEEDEDKESVADVLVTFFSFIFAHKKIRFLLRFLFA